MLEGSFNESTLSYPIFDGLSAGASNTLQSNRNLVAINVNLLNRCYCAESGGLILHDRKVDCVSIVGRAENLVEQTTCSVFMLRDDCGPAIEVNAWKLHDSRDAAIVTPPIAEKALVKVFGQVRRKEERIYIAAHKVFPVVDMNEIGIHNLEVIYHFKMLERMKNQVVAEINTNGGPMEFAVTQSGLNSTLDAVLKRIINDETPEGIILDEIILSLPLLDNEIIRQALNSLLDNGHIYTTVDDVHFKATNVE